MTRQRRHYSPDQKVALLREHLVDKVPVSDICEKNGIAVNLFYFWQKTFFENGQAAFTVNDKSRNNDTDALWASTTLFLNWSRSSATTILVTSASGSQRVVPTNAVRVSTWSLRTRPT